MRDCGLSRLTIYLQPKRTKLKSNFLKTLGPGILFASTAIGVSHLVQSTRAGADYGFALLWAVILANVLKYPFFEFGSRYANATGTSLIDGYRKIGRWMLFLYFLIVIGSMFFVTAAVGSVTAGFLGNLFGIDAHMLVTAVLFVLCFVILFSGKYSALDKLTKLIGGLLLVTTLLAFVLTLFHGPAEKSPDFIAPEVWTPGGIAFLIALMGWMPTAVDLSTWNSLWTIARIKQTGFKPTLKQTLFEFNLGYWISAGLALCFITLGAYLLYGTGTEMPKDGAGFANGVVGLYTTTIGKWSYFIIAVAAFSIMFGTSIAVFDGYARSLERTVELLVWNTDDENRTWSNKTIYSLSLILVALGAFALIWSFQEKPDGFRGLVDLATTISFLVAPLIAGINFYLVSKGVGREAVPPLWMKILSWLGLIFLTGFSIFYLGTKF